MAAFREYHIPAGLVKIKRDEFRNLMQGNKSVNEYLYQFTELAHYAPADVDTDEKKQEAFIQGVNPDLKTHLSGRDYASFAVMINKAILVEKARNEEKRAFKRKIQEFRLQRQERNLRQRTFSTPTFRAPVSGQFKVQTSSPAHFGQTNSSFTKTQQQGVSQAASNTVRDNVRACYECGNPNHFRSNCPRLR